MIAGFVTLAVLLALTVVLPILSFLRASAARDAVERLDRRLIELEEQIRTGRLPTAAPLPEPRSADAVPETVARPQTPPDPVETPPPPPGSPPTRAAPPDQPANVPARLEARIGGQWMLYVGVLTLVIGMGFFIQYAFARQWVTEPLRVFIGVVTGLLLVLSGRRFVTTGHCQFGHALVGGGIATWYLAVYAALNLYGLVGPAAGFALLVLVTALAAVFADRLRSQPLAMVAAIGGFGTPFLVGFDTPALFMLLGYTALLIGATVYLASRRDWPALNLVGFVLTGLTVSIWYARFYRPSGYLPTELFFTLYGGLFLWVLYRMGRSTHSMAAVVRLALWTTPVWYHAASLTILGDHWLALLVYLIAVTGVGVTLAVRWEAMWPRVLLWVAVAAPLLDWAAGQPDGSWVWPGVVTWLAVASMHAYAQIELLRRIRALLPPADVLLVPANGLGLYFGLQSVVAPHHPAFLGLVAVLVAIAHGALTSAVRRVEPRAAMHLLVVAGTLAVVAVAVQLDGAWVTMLWTTEAAGLIWLGLGERRSWVRAIGAAVLGVAALRMLSLQLELIPAAYTVFLNQRATLGLFMVGSFRLVAWLYARTDPDAIGHRHQAIATAIVGAHVLMLVTLSTEIQAFWELREDTARFASSAEFARQMMLSVTWGAYAIGLIAVGIKRRYAPIRYLAIVVLGITVLKLFIVDFAQLESVYRIAGTLALGLLLVGASYLYQRYGAALNSVGESEPPTDDERPIRA